VRIVRLQLPNSAIALWLQSWRPAGRVAWAGTYYQAQREKGKSHAWTLRCLGQRWLKILWKLWQSRRPYDETVHTLNQQRHGSWVLQLQPKKN
jgi:hypothetical protein